MQPAFKTGLSFGITSGIITTLGLIVGLHAGTHSRLAVIGGILTIAIADAFSDALGMHISEESNSSYSLREIWQASGATFLAKFIFALTFIIPIVIFTLGTAIVISIIWGLLALSALSYRIGQNTNKKSWLVVIEHLVIAVIVIILTQLIGKWISTFLQ